MCTPRVALKQHYCQQMYTVNIYMCVSRDLRKRLTALPSGAAHRENESCFGQYGGESAQMRNETSV